MAVAAVADEVDHRVAGMGLAPLDRDLRRARDRPHIVAIDVQDAAIDRLPTAGAIGRAAGLAGLRGEAQLIVDDDMHRAPRC